MNKEALIWAIVIFVFVSSGVEAGKFITTENGQRFYMEIEHKFNWFEAVDKCSQMKMELISMDSPEKTQHLYNLYRTNFGSVDKELWIGGHDHNFSRRFEWISSGEDFGYTNWYEGQPNDANDHCVEMYTSDSLKWYDYSCNSKYGFVCEEKSLRIVTNKLVLLQASLDNQTNLLNEKTEQFDLLQKDFEKFQKESQEKQTNLKLEFNEQMNIYKQGLEEMKQKQEEFVILQNSAEQQNKQELRKKTEELDALKNEFDKFRKEIQVNLKLEYDEKNKLNEQRLQEIKQNQEEIIILQKFSEEQMVRLNQTQKELDALKAQISNETELKQMLKDMQTNQLQNQNQIIDAFTKIAEMNKSGAIKSTVNQDISNPISYETQAALLKAKREELEDLKQTNKMLMEALVGALHKSYDLNTNRTTPNKNYNIFPNFSKT